MIHSELDNLIHSPKRLEMLAILAGADRASFAHLREQLQISEADLSRQIRRLQEAGIIKVVKLSPNPQKGTWISITPNGLDRFRNHMRLLRSL